MGYSNAKVLIGGIHADERGTLWFNNRFDLASVRRFYIIKHPDTSVIRAWQGHQHEHKYFMCIKGSFVVAWKEIDESNTPRNDAEAAFEILRSDENRVLSIPPGHANGLKAILPDSEIMVFSDKTMEDSMDDDIRFDETLWLDWSQFQ